MPSPLIPKSDCNMQMSPVTDEELAQVIKRCKFSLSPSPLDCISYAIFKRFSSLHPALLDLYNRVIKEGSIPSAWKEAAVKLLPKSSAKENPSFPGNLRPSTLTLAVSKLLLGIVKDRWLRHMCPNGYLNSDLQKMLFPCVVEHQAKLIAVINSAHCHRQAQAVCWFDIANVYRSLQHSLIQVL